MNDNNLLQQIQTELVQPTNTFSNILRLALILAHRLNSESLKVWVTQELNGYTQVETLPDYREIAARSFCSYLTVAGKSLYRHPKAQVNIDMEFVNQYEVMAGISDLEDMQAKTITEPKSVLQIDWMPDMFDAFAAYMQQQGGQLSRVWQEVSPSSIAQVIDSAKNRLLDSVLELEGYADDSGNPIENIKSSDVENLVQTIILENTEIRLGDTNNMSNDQYNISQAGAVGPNAKAENMTFNQIQLQHQASLDVIQLSEELKQLCEAMIKSATQLEQYIEIGALAKAEAEAKNGNKSKAFEALTKVGKWSLETAISAGTKVAAEAIRTSLGM